MFLQKAFQHTLLSLLLLCLCLYTGSCSSNHFRSNTPSQLDKKIAAFATNDISGKPIVFPQAGTVTVIEFLSPHCASCARMTADLDRFWRCSDKNKFQVIGVVLDANQAQAVQLKRRKKVDFSWVVDEEFAVASRYQIKGVPSVFVIDQHGGIQFVADGSSGDSERITHTVRALLEE